MSVNVVAFFCEDIRREANGQLTIVGTLPDTVNVTRIPTTLPKLGIVLRVHLSADEKIPKSIAANFSGPNTEGLTPISWKSEVIEKAFSQLRKNEIPFSGFIGRAMSIPFPVKEPGLITITLTVDGKDYPAGALRINLLQPTASEQPSEQSQPAASKS